MDGHGITASASLGLALEAPRGAVQHASETGKPQQDSSPTSQNHPSKNCLTLLSDALKEDEERPTQLPDITWQAASILILLKWHHLTGSGEIAKKTKESQAVDGHGLTASASLGLNLGAPRGTVQHASETGKPQQDSSPTRQNHPSKNCLTLLSDALKKERWRKANVTAWHHLTGRNRNFGAPRGTVQHASCIRNRETPAGFKPNPPKPSIEKVPDVAFWRPKERWRKANATAWHITWQAASNWKDINWQAAAKLLNSQGKPGSGRPWNNSFGLAWIGLRSPERRRSTCIRNRETPAGFKPNQPKPSVEKLPDVAFWRPKGRWRKANATAWHHLTGSVDIVKMTSPDRQRRNC